MDSSIEQALQIPNFQDVHLIVIGDVMLDSYWSSDVSRISPEAPVPVANIGRETHRAGGAANTAVNVAELGCRVSLLGLVGEDGAASELLDLLEAHQVESYLLAVPDHATIKKLRVMSHNQQLLRMDFEKNFEEDDADNLLKQYKKLLSSAGGVIISDYNKGSLPDVRELIRLAKKKSVPVFVDPKRRDYNNFRGASVLTPNYREFIEAVGECADQNEFEEKAFTLIDACQLSGLLITCGADGMTLVQADHDVQHIPAYAHDVYDITGAGDTVIAALAASIVAGESLMNAAMLANLAASIVVSKLGTAAVSPGELRSGLKRAGMVSNSVVTQHELLHIVDESRQHHKRIVMTNGCFDILHAGHVAYLTRAKQFGDVLIVAVNDDASVQRLKGHERPVNAVEERSTVLSALAVVDWVVVFSEDTPRDLIMQIMPDVLVKGGDYQPEEIAGAREVIDNGGQVEIIPYIPGLSTSEILQRGAK